MKFLIVSNSQITKVNHAIKWSVYIRRYWQVDKFHMPAKLANASNTIKQGRKRTEFEKVTLEVFRFTLGSHCQLGKEVFRSWYTHN